MDDKQRDVQKEKKIAKETKNNNSEKGEWRDKNSIERYKPPNERERERDREKNKNKDNNELTANKQREK